jgi:hypothetical protein
MRLNEIHTPFYDAINQLRPQIAQAAQVVYDSWDEEELGGGGICDQIANEIGSVISDAGFGVVDGGHDGDDHAWIIAYNHKESFVVDIPHHIYETGGGYSWQKIPGIQFTPDHVVVEPIDRPDYID